MVVHGAITAADARTNLGLGANDRPTLRGLTTSGTGITAQGIDSQGSSIVSQSLSPTDNSLVAQGEFRADTNGNVSIINRGITASDATHF